MKNAVTFFVCSSLLAPLTTLAEENGQQSDVDQMEEMLITGGKDGVKNLSGSAHVLDKSQLEDYDYTDIHRVISQVPGVYIRDEDGFGLRPNIGIRGVTTDRSQKINIMEDGILIGPAPYSAPAAYYFPNVNRMQAVEVVKGPSSIAYGPNTVGGSINLVSKPVPTEAEGEAAISYGTDNYQKFSGSYGEKIDQFGYLIEALRYSSDGFKELDGGGDTGFVRNDINAKFTLDGDADASVKQSWTFKVGYADEDSDETYLGLSDADYKTNPNRRYKASALDKFESEHTQLHVLNTLEFSDNFKLNNKVYFNQFDRAWFKFDGFIPANSFATPIPARTVLANPNSFPQLFAILRGDVDSGANQTIDITDFDRSYGSHGIESVASFIFESGDIDHELDTGLRYHHDYVERNHVRYGYLMRSGQLVRDTNPSTPVTVNEGKTDAISAFANYKVSIWRFDLTSGLRVESIDGELTDKLDASKNNSRTSTEVIPGLGTVFHLTDNFSFLGGINKGFSPAGPSANDNVDSEESINYEWGFRYNEGDVSIELINFFSDYDNLIGRCRVSDSGCTVGDEFNGGNVEVAGMEVITRYSYNFDGFTIPLNVTYTYTDSAFQSSFESSFSQWGLVSKGDELPYLPEHQMRLETGVRAAKWDVLLAVKYTGEMREIAGQGDINAVSHLEPLTTLDISSSYHINNDWTVQFNIDNVADAQEIVSRRPFGARPNKPRTAIATVKYRF